MTALSARRPAPPHRSPLRRTGALACAALLLALPGARAQTALLDRIAVTVNNAAITESELSRTERELREADRRLRGETLRKAALERLILIRLQEDEARRLGLQVDEATLERALLSIAEQNGVGDLVRFRRLVEADGVRWEDLRESVRQQVLIDRVREREVRRQLRVSEQEIDDYLSAQAATQTTRHFRLEHFMVPLPAGADNAALERAQAAVDALRRALARGDSAAQVRAGLHERGIAIEGGQLGWRNPADLPPPMDGLVAALSAGQFSAPVPDNQGVHILRVIDTRSAEVGAVTQLRARHILLEQTPLRDDWQAQRELRALRDRALAGEDFAALAREHSEDYASALMGGDLGWFTPGTMSPAFEHQLQLLSPGQLSPPFQSPFGWHLARLEDRRERLEDSSARREAARAALIERKLPAATERWLEQLRDRAWLEYPGRS